MIINDEQREITPAVWDVFTDWYGDKAYRKADFVERIEAAVRAQVAKERAAEEGERLITDAGTFSVEEVTNIDSDGDSVLYEVWVKRGDGDG
ncbi:hypothetical protein [Streptomyces niveus]|uniref:hypothetical protein n=1 Tax=Streptomyces niveus TaxID=193462 RepID=UPI0036543241